ncbi:PPM-type phosphatase domain [Sesbania bispinosa]|nr:PPM-type phosphatase domain [Sesbania bispinosa]
MEVVTDKCKGQKKQNDNIIVMIDYTLQQLTLKKFWAQSDPDSGKGKSKMSKHTTHGFHLVKGRSDHEMEDYHVAQFKQIDNNELGLFAILMATQRNQVNWVEGGSTAVTAILINCQKLVVANIGDSRAVLCKNGVAKQLSVDHEPNTESEDIKNRGGFVSNFPGDVPRVDGQLAVSRAFGDKSLKKHLSSEPYVTVEIIDDDAEFVILASDGLWKVMSNQEAVDAIRNIKDTRSAAKYLTEEARNRKSSDDISCVVVRFQ